MNSRTMVIDGILAVAVATLVVVVSPGAAVTGMIALVVLIVCAISIAADSRARRARGARRARRAPAPRRAPRRR